MPRSVALAVPQLVAVIPGPADPDLSACSTHFKPNRGFSTPHLLGLAAACPGLVAPAWVSRAPMSTILSIGSESRVGPVSP